MELHIVHSKDGVTNPLKTDHGIAVTGFFFNISVSSKYVHVIDKLI